MNSAHHVNLPPGANPAVAAASGAASLSDLAADSGDYVRAWSALFASETRLAGISVMRLFYGALVLPALALCICLTLDALLAALFQRWFGDWASATALVLCLNLMGLFGLALAMRAWWRNLSLPRSRQALGRVLERMA